MKIEAAKNIIDAQFLKAIYSDVDLDGFHPMRVIQALKSLIGINIEKPSIKLIEWGDNYLNNIKLLPDNHFKYSINKPKETIVLSNLGECIASKNKNDCISELQDLCSVSDGNQIFEYLIEFSSEHGIHAIPFIWSAYRTNLFLKNKYCYQLLFLCVNNLIRKKSDNIKSNSISEFEILCIIESIKNTSLTRQYKINRKLNNFTLDFSSHYKCETDMNRPIDVVGKGRKAILDYLNNLDSEYITKEMILFLDSGRMVLKDSDRVDYQKLSNVLNYTIEGRLYVDINW